MTTCSKAFFVAVTVAVLLILVIQTVVLVARVTIYIRSCDKAVFLSRHRLHLPWLDVQMYTDCIYRDVHCCRKLRIVFVGVLQSPYAHYRTMCLGFQALGELVVLDLDGKCVSVDDALEQGLDVGYVGDAGFATKETEHRL